MRDHYDFVVIGAGIVGLAIARQLKLSHPDCTIALLEKEAELGAHASGRNSGVLHSGIYYPEQSLKARVCVEGNRELAAYCEAKGLPLQRIGKVIVPTHEQDSEQLEVLLRRGLHNGVRVARVDEGRLRELEPEVRSPTGTALHLPDAAVLDPRAVLRQLAADLLAQGVEILFEHRPEAYDPGRNQLRVRGMSVTFGHLYNSAGLHADVVARALGAGQRYAILPFKGMYYDLADPGSLRINGLIYPVPDLRVPFLGIHFTRSVDGHIHVGPNAVPALGRENYRGLDGVTVPEAGRIAALVVRQYLANKQGFRQLAHLEGSRLFRDAFARAAQVMVPRLQASQLVRSAKVGIRAQLLDLETGELVMDFRVERQESATHVLNAVSPAFTSAFGFARLAVDG